ncbi:S8 family peptidase [Promicromonospora sp. NPDC052451]|uniref:S8 family peptidase n=1 Tax=Promicromonospora sp. NPDC052451 TaxID=3364407 RepID=UPI0037C7C403
MADRDRPHILVSSSPDAEGFTLPVGRGAQKHDFTGNRVQHGRRLVREFEDSWKGEDEHDGTYITFESFPGIELALESLDPQSSGEQPELVAVRARIVDDEVVQEATVYVPFGKKEYFLKRLTKYVETAQSDSVKHAALVEAISSIRRATIRELWTDPEDQFPSDSTEPRWWEVWLRNRDGQEQERLTRFAQAHQLRTSAHFLGFNDRTVILLNATAEQLAQAFGALDDIAELRRPHDVTSFLTELPAAEQKQWVDDLLSRLQTAGPDSPVVCVLDTGVYDGHPLLAGSLDSADVHVADQGWTPQPTNPHGTEMSGLALYGDLAGAVTSALPVRLEHRLESVKILPDNGANESDLLGAITARAVDQPEIRAADRPRVFMLAVTAPEGDADRPNVSRAGPGKPTSWSTALDALAFGRAIDDSAAQLTYLDRDEPRHPRLFVVSAGNIRDVRPGEDHIDRSDVEPVEDPAQAWNALTVGAYSPRDDMAGAPAEFAGWVPIAPRGELAPSSRTSVLFGRKIWPFKPEVVADGGNNAVSPDQTDVDTPPNLALLTTRMQRLGEGFFTTTRDTSAATAQVAAIAADIYAAYPHLRPESVRALIVHSAEWTEAMKGRFAAATSKGAVGTLLRRYGMGVPDRDRAIRSAVDALTLVVESQLHPFEHEGSGDGRAREMNLHRLPWPADVLEDLSGEEVRLRVTLSYFVEPNPSRRGWNGRYAYPSFGLRFATKRAEESVDSFRRRINTRARDGEYSSAALATEKGWVLGADQQQAPGSLHTDIWTGTAADLASKSAIAVYPVAGWWKRRPKLDQSDFGVDYSLVVSIESRNVEVDLWTPVMQQIAAPVEIEA